MEFGRWIAQIGGNFIAIWKDDGSYEKAPSLSRKHGKIAEVALDAISKITKEDIAIGNLIAAAPDLLEQLQESQGLLRAIYNTATSKQAYGLRVLVKAGVAGKMLDCIDSNAAALYKAGGMKKPKDR